MRVIRVNSDFPELRWKITHPRENLSQFCIAMTQVVDPNERYARARKPRGESVGLFNREKSREREKSRNREKSRDRDRDSRRHWGDTGEQVRYLKCLYLSRILPQSSGKFDPEGDPAL